MKRGEIWSLAGGKDYAGKPRPVVIVQDECFAETRSITVCGFTTNPADSPLFRVLVEPSERNGLRTPSRLMADRINTVPRTKLGMRVGHMDDADMTRLNRAMLVFLGLAA
ncbi:MAG TPA: type II toxin-antitoxin system PemK/MazF family toxin [Acidisphaera sp.]|nr:type II toxin-antitoxin system PemK/MazF family toxin [Acidisphaera sp.]